MTETDETGVQRAWDSLLGLVACDNVYKKAGVDALLTRSDTGQTRFSLKVEDGVDPTFDSEALKTAFKSVGLPNVCVGGTRFVSITGTTEVDWISFAQKMDAVRHELDRKARALLTKDC